MYKRRIKQWNLRKYFSVKDIPEIERQRAIGCRPGYLILPGGRVRDFRSADSFLKRRAPASCRLSNPGQRQLIGISERHLSASTSPYLPASTSLSPCSAEALLHSIKTYFDFSSPNFIWNKDMQDRLCISKQGGLNGRFRLSRFHDRLLVAVNNFTHRNNAAGLVKCRVVMGECLDGMRVILLEQDPFLLANILHILLQIKKHRPPHTDRNDNNPLDRNQGSSERIPELDQVFVDYVKNLSTIALGESHPLTAVWTVLETICTVSPVKAQNRNEADQKMISDALELILDNFQAQVGPHHAASLIMRLHLYSASRDVRWKEALVDLLTILEGGRVPGKTFCRLKWALEINEFSQERVNRVTKFICQLLRARLRGTVEEGEDLCLDKPLSLDPEAELVQCLLSPRAVTDLDYLP